MVNVVFEKRRKSVHKSIKKPCEILMIFTERFNLRANKIANFPAQNVSLAACLAGCLIAAM
jgi:hypothetical protein